MVRLAKFGKRFPAGQEGKRKAGHIMPGLWCVFSFWLIDHFDAVEVSQWHQRLSWISELDLLTGSLDCFQLTPMLEISRLLDHIGLLVFGSETETKCCLVENQTWHRRRHLHRRDGRQAVIAEKVGDFCLI